MKYKRILLKLSGEALMGEKNFGIDNNRLTQYAEEIKTIVDKGVQKVAWTGCRAITWVCLLLSLTVWLCRVH